MNIMCLAGCANEKIAELNGCPIYKEDFMNYKAAAIVHNEMLKIEFDPNNYSSSYDDLSAYEYEKACKIANGDDETLLQMYLCIINLVNNNIEENEYTDELSRNLIEELSYIPEETFLDILGKAGVSEEKLKNDCIPYYANINIAFGKVHSEYLKNVYNEEPMPKQPNEEATEEEIIEYFSRHNDWILKEQKAFEEYVQKQYENADVVIY